MSPRRDFDRVADMRRALRLILSETGGGRAQFMGDVCVQWLVVAQLGIVGEAARAMSAEFRLAHPQVPWRDLVTVRNLLVHEYFDIDVEGLWQTVETAVPALDEMVSRILEEQA